jgi:hypothetical protein
MAIVGAALLAGCAHEAPAPARVEAPAGELSFDDCDVGEESTVPADFPRGVLAPAGPREKTLVCALSAHLDALGEPSMFPLPSEGQTYRLLWLRRVGRPVSVRFELEADGAQVRGAQTAGIGGETPGELLEESTATLDPDSAREVLSKVEAAGLWTRPVQPAPDAVVDDGSTWVFEGVRSGKYRARLFHRVALSHDRGFRELGQALVRSSGLHVQGAVY